MPRLKINNSQQAFSLILIMHICKERWVEKIADYLSNSKKEKPIYFLGFKDC